MVYGRELFKFKIGIHWICWQNDSITPEFWQTLIYENLKRAIQFHASSSESVDTYHTYQITTKTVFFTKRIQRVKMYHTRMHSSRMRTVRCNGRRGCLPRGCLPRGGLPQCMLWYNPPVDRILDTRLWKHYLSAATLWTVKITSRIGKKHCSKILPSVGHHCLQCG